jgi:hypothetical protein
MIEHDIERVLEGLGRVEPPQGLEERVLRAMAARPATGQRWFALAWATAATLVVTAAVMAVSKLRESALAVEQQTMAQAGAVDSIAPTYHSSPAQVSPAFRMNVATVLTPASSARSTHRAIPEHERLDTESLGEKGAEEAGFPAPPAPLTDQERLLLRLARRPNEATIAMFDPAIREERAAAEKEEFDFLNPQRPVETDQPTDSTIKEEKSNDRSQSKW